MIQLAAAFSRHLPYLREPRPDGELLAVFLAERDEDAFAELVRRHGPLVWAACRRTLPDATDAEDAFQTSFLVLVRRARRLRSRDTIGPWLYQVAVWTSRNIRRRNARILAKRQPLGDTAAAAMSPDLRNDLDEALAALPEKYRTPLVLCHLQGWSRREAAARLGCPEGTLSSLLSRGLERLRVKLAGIDPAKALAVAAPAVPMLLASSTVKAAAGMHLAASATVHQLVEGVVRMFWIKKATAASFALVAMFGMGIGIGVSVQQVPGAAAGDEPGAAEGAKAEAQRRYLQVMDEVELAYAEEQLAQATRTGDTAKVAEANAHLAAALEKARRARVRFVEVRDDQIRKMKADVDARTEAIREIESILKAAKDKLAKENAENEKVLLRRAIERLSAELQAAQEQEAAARAGLERLARELAEKDDRTAEQRKLDAQIAKLMAEQRALEAEAEKLALMRELKQRELAKLKETRATKVLPVETLDAIGVIEITANPDNKTFGLKEIGADGKTIGTATFENFAILKQFLLRVGRDVKSHVTYRVTGPSSDAASLQRVIDVLRVCESAGLEKADAADEKYKRELLEKLKEARPLPEKPAK